MLLGNITLFRLTMKESETMCKVVKTKRAEAQWKWYLTCQVNHPNVEFSDGKLTLDLVKGVPLCVTSNEKALERVFDQVDEWAKRPTESGTWREYVDSIKHRATQQALSLMRSVDVPMGTFCHGDLTLENVLVSKNQLWYIDPNPGAFSSHWLDLGKLAFSMEYHERCGSYWLDEVLKSSLHNFIWDYQQEFIQAALVSHIVRLRGYQPDSIIEEWLRCVC